MHQVILIHPDAPTKPTVGEACNGCGVCCLSAPCPAGSIVSLKRSGACDVLRWDATGKAYRCGLMPRGRGFWRALWRRLVRRYIAAGQGCDSTLVIDEPVLSAGTLTR